MMGPWINESNSPLKIRADTFRHLVISGFSDMARVKSCSWDYILPTHTYDTLSQNGKEINSRIGRQYVSV